MIDPACLILKQSTVNRCVLSRLWAMASRMVWLKMMSSMDISCRKVCLTLVRLCGGRTTYGATSGAIVFSNIWAMTHDPNVYPDPFTFKPERFLNEDGKSNDDNRVLAYGFGRRLLFLHSLLRKKKAHALSMIEYALER